MMPDRHDDGVRDAALTWLDSAGESIDKQADPTISIARALIGLGFAFIAVTDDLAAANERARDSAEDSTA